MLAGDGARVREVEDRKAGEELRTAQREGRPPQLIYYGAGMRLGDWRNEGLGEDLQLA